MLKATLARLQQGHRTMKFPDGPAPQMPDRFRGRLAIDVAKCRRGCALCAEACPTAAVNTSGHLQIDLGRCLFCGQCTEACPEGAIADTQDYRLTARRREDLVVQDGMYKIADALQGEARKLFGRSLKLRQVSAGGCNACEADTNVLNTVGWDLGRFGVQFVASPRHADGLLITGPVPENMRLALMKTYEAVPAPKLVIVVGACAISGGPFAGHPEVHNGATGLLPVDLFIPG